MQLTGAKSTIGRIDILDCVETDTVKFNSCCIPIIRIFDHLNDVILPPGFQDEWSVTHVVPGRRPFRVALADRSKLQDGWRVNGIELLGSKQGRQRGIRSDQVEAQSMRINGLHANFVKIRDLASEIRLGAFKHKKEIRIDRAQLSSENPLKTKNEIARRNRVTVGPFGVRANVKSPNRGVFIMLPAFGHPRVLFGSVLRIADDQAFNQRGEYSSVRDPLYQAWIKAFGFAADG